uniref:RNA cytidine acetyltransferase n=1 Tax=Elaeophora elaphi TaxID=1147741 RepID=A0A0R3RVQ4_9BILA
MMKVKKSDGNAAGRREGGDVVIWEVLLNMVRTKLDNRIRILIENGVATGHRSMFVIIGDKGKDQVVILHHILSKATVAARPSVLWCYKKELGFTSHRKKRMKELKRKMRNGRMDIKDNDPFELFISSTHIRYCYYAETHKILGSTFGMLVLQDFEAITPNLLARTIETIEGGGVIVLLLKSVSSLKQLFTMTMDVHSRFRTESHSEVVPRFNERFILSLASCRSCAVVDDRLNVLPLSSHALKIEAVPASLKNQFSTREEELISLKNSLTETKPLSFLLNKCRTLCQAKTLLRLLDVITEKTLQATCCITAARGRGKSAALGLAIAGAIGFDYANIFVTSPAPDNLKTLFEFVVKGLEAMNYEEHTDFELIQSTNKQYNKALVRINIFKGHRQVIQYIDPRDSVKLSQAELVVVDEAAAIPLPIVKKLISGPYLVFLASTISGYEGTGRSLSLKLLQQLREQAAGLLKNDSNEQMLVAVKGRALHELVLEESIRYKSGDQIETWLNRVLCLNACSAHQLVSGMPPLKDCQLLYVNRDTLFSFHKASETFLHNIMAIYVSAHYKNSPNDLQMLSDAPAHHLFVLVGPIDEKQAQLPEILAVVQLAMEGALSSATVCDNMGRGKRAAGDLLPWTVSQQFMDKEFPTLSGARIIRIAVHPDFQSVGYGSRALELLFEYYHGMVPCLKDETDFNMEAKAKHIENHDALVLLEEVIEPRADLPPLLHRLSERRAEKLDYIGVSFGLNLPLLKFWKRAGFVPVYLRQSVCDLTGEHTCIMLKDMNKGIKRMFADEEDLSEGSTAWLSLYWTEFRRRILHLFGFEFSKFLPQMALSILQLKNNGIVKQCKREVLTREELGLFLSNNDLCRLSQYARNMIDHHLITDILPVLALLYFEERFDEKVKLTTVQSAILLGAGLQHKTVDVLVTELDLPANQLLALFNKAIRKLSEYLDQLCMDAVRQEIDGQRTSEHSVDAASMQPIPISLDDELHEAAVEIRKRQDRDRARLKEEIGRELKQYTIKGSEDDWANVLQSTDLKTAKKIGTILSVKSSRTKSKSVDRELLEETNKFANRKRKRKFKSFK